MEHYSESKMSTEVTIDEIDVKILRELIKDARAKLKGIARNCDLSVPAILKRIDRLKTTGVITGSVLYLNMSEIGYMQPASLMIEVTPDQEPLVIKIVKKLTNLVMIEKSIGQFNLAIFLVENNFKKIDYIKQTIRRQTKVGKIQVSFWQTPEFNFGNIDIKPTGS